MVSLLPPLFGLEKMSETPRGQKNRWPQKHFLDTFWGERARRFKNNRGEGGTQHWSSNIAPSHGGGGIGFFSVFREEGREEGALE